MKKNLLLFVCLSAALISACQSSGPKKNLQEQTRTPSSREAQGPLNFDLAFFRSVYEKNGQENFLMSPPSIRILLGMAYLGVNPGSSSQKELAAALGLSMDKEVARAQLQELARNLSLKGNVTIQNGNIVYAKRKLEQAWIEDVSRTFNGFVFDDSMLKNPEQLRKLESQMGLAEDSLGADPAENMNKYVEFITQNKIKNFVTSDDVSDPLLVAILVNALYFKGPWEQRFHPLKTQKNQPFFGGASADYMVRESVKEFQMEKGKCAPKTVLELYYQNDRVQVLSLPFKRKKQKADGGLPSSEGDETIASMYFILPKKGLGLDQLVAGELTNTNFWQSVRAGLRPAEMSQIKIPKFKYETETFDLLEHAKKKELGISNFINHPEVAGISREIQEVSKFAQKAAVQVNEDGAELAAATKASVGLRSISPSYPLAEFIADRPFAYAVVLHRTNEIAFLGTVKSPSYDTKGEKPYEPGKDPVATCYASVGR